MAMRMSFQELQNDKEVVLAAVSNGDDAAYDVLDSESEELPQGTGPGLLGVHEKMHATPSEQKTERGVIRVRDSVLKARYRELMTATVEGF